jgi:hypothetical protein
MAAMVWRLALVVLALTALRLVFSVRSARSRAQRGVRAQGVIGYCGLWGSGKTLAMTRDLILAMRAGQRVVATYHILDPVTGLQAEYIDPEAEDFVDQIAAIRAPDDTEEEIAAAAKHAAWIERSRWRRWARRHLGAYGRSKRIPKVVVGFDEINVIFPSRMWASMPVKMLYAWAQGGKRGIAVRWTAQTEKRVDTVAREVSHEVAKTKVFFAMFGRPILLRQGFYLPEDMGATGEALAKKRIRARWVFVPWWVLEGYDTLEQVRPSAHLERIKDAARGRRAA